ncbi:MAG: carboxypeptidase-like regulatory domain-containing protein [Candidatus Eremiobacterota bacterium]
MSKNLLISIIVPSIISGIIIASCGDSGSNQITVPPTVTSTAIPDLVTIKGQALEINGTPITNAFVVCVNQGLSASLSALADKLGNYLFKNLPPGNYRIEIWRSEGDHNSSPGSPIGAVNITVTEGTVTVNVTAGNIEPTATPTVTPAVTNTPTVTNTPGGPTNTPTSTNTPGGPTNTPTSTNTPGGSNNTPTPSWKYVGNAKFSEGLFADATSLYVYNGTPYASYVVVDSGDAYCTVMMYNGSTWTPVGNSRVSLSTTTCTSLYISNGIPYVAYSDNLAIRVKKFDGTNWVTVGNAGFSAATVDCLSISVSNGIPYVGYVDWENGEFGRKASVMKFSN